MDHSTLQILWFILIAVLFIGYFILEGFDFGVGINVYALGRRDETRQRMILRSIGPVWDGNEVWLLTGGGALFAAFPEWYASLFTGFYLALLLILLALIVRVCAFKYRDKIDSPRWRAGWNLMHFLGGLLPALLWGVAFANIVQGVGLNQHKEVTTTLLGLLNPFGLLGGIVFVLLFWLHGTLFLALKVDGKLREDANRLAGILIYPTIVAGAAFLLWTQFAYSNKLWTWIPLIIAALALVAIIPLNRMRREGWSFAATSLAIAMAAVVLFGSLFPNVLPSTTDPAFSLTIYNASSTKYTLEVMTIATICLLPFVLAYQAWTYWVFRRRITEDEIPASAGLLPRAKDAYRKAFS
ncbi:cytochrome d ubiquinol oxidase subunit II [Devriesea agamarum]|uniref:cytochrome d ubiquinol oxidase subunit II n=1 Tax=Devriesea agamarum TaxID=472569 RepID=UPI00071DBE8E|nr:cytochrome d ubiquinol oxidase subunit II [Devriesea agamarum]